jgi:hypothetical protein
MNYDPMELGGWLLLCGSAAAIIILMLVIMFVALKIESAAMRGNNRRRLREVLPNHMFNDSGTQDEAKAAPRPGAPSGRPRPAGRGPQARATWAFVNYLPPSLTPFGLRANASHRKIPPADVDEADVKPVPGRRPALHGSAQPKSVQLHPGLDAIWADLQREEDAQKFPIGRSMQFEDRRMPAPK